jgi:excisionase family DNA binding protein
MSELKQKYGITSAAWRSALARHFAEMASESRVVEPTRPTGREYLSPEEAAAELGVHVQTIRVYVRSGKIPALRLAGERAIRIRRTDLDKVLEPLAPQG